MTGSGRGTSKKFGALILHSLLNPPFRISKSATVRAGGGNLTNSHVEDLSLCALFLMSAAKKTDQEFCCHRTTAHSVRDANRDIDKIVHVLHEKNVTSLLEGRNSPLFEDPTEKGLKKLCNTKWVQETLARNPVDEDFESLQEEHVADIDYEIADIN